MYYVNDVQSKKRSNHFHTKISRMEQKNVFIPIRWRRFVGLVVDIDEIRELATVIFHKCVNNPNHILKETITNDYVLCLFAKMWCFENMMYKYNRKNRNTTCSYFQSFRNEKCIKCSHIYYFLCEKEIHYLLDISYFLQNNK